MTEGDFLSMWLVYDHLPDYPNNYVARRWIVGKGEGEKPTGDMMICPDLEAIRSLLHSHGLVPLPRHPSDDPKIVESWI